MYAEYLDNIRALGRRSFTMLALQKELNISEDAAKCGLYRLRKAGKVMSPVNGLYVIVPPECRPYGSVPAEELIVLIMRYLNADYYVGLLSAAVFYGAAHQKPARFQVITNKRIKHSLKFGQVEIELIYKKSLSNLPLRDFVVATGYLNVASPELIALDLFGYPYRAAGISHIATVLYELIESIDAKNLIKLAEDINEVYQLQRLGYVIEKLDVIDIEKQQNLVDSLHEYLSKIKTSYIPLVPDISRSGYSRCKKWRIIENSDFESDL